MPALSISIGIKPTKATWTASACSKPEMIIPVNVAETMSSISQGMRFFQISKILERMMPVEKALGILDIMANKEGKLDPELTRLFRESRCWEKD